MTPCSLNRKANGDGIISSSRENKLTTLLKIDIRTGEVLVSKTPFYQFLKTYEILDFTTATSVESLFYWHHQINTDVSKNLLCFESIYNGVYITKFRDSSFAQSSTHNRIELNSFKDDTLLQSMELQQKEENKEENHTEKLIKGSLTMEDVY